MKEQFLYHIYVV